jgi:hypothetical protein
MPVFSACFGCVMYVVCLIELVNSLTNVCSIHMMITVGLSGCVAHKVSRPVIWLLSSHIWSYGPVFDPKHG